MAEKTGVPPELLALIHYRENTNDYFSGTFGVHLHNGQELGKTTTVYPVGICFYDFDTAAVDAMKGQQSNINQFNLTADSQDLVAMLCFAECYNGKGYYNNGNSGISIEKQEESEGINSSINPFFPYQGEESLYANGEYYDENMDLVESAVKLKISFIKAYENGSVYKLSMESLNYYCQTADYLGRFPQIISDGNTCHSLRSMRQKHIISGVTADYRGLISVQLWLD